MDKTKVINFIYDFVSREITESIKNNPDDLDGYFFDNAYSAEGEGYIRKFDQNDSYDFYLTENSLVIIYQKYTLKPGAYGVQTFEIPYNLFVDLSASGDDLSLPPVVNLYQYQNEYSPSGSGFRFWGWSKNGKVAYTYDFGDGGVTTTYATIFNFVRDTETWSKTELLDYDDNGNVLPPSGDFLQEFRNACMENGIEFVQAKYRKLPSVHNNKTYKVVLEIGKRELNAGDPDLLVVDNYRIFVHTDGKTKVVHEAKEEYPAYNIFPLGYFISPFENRALIVMGKHILGGHVFTFFVGCYLDSGFTDAATFTVEEATERTRQGGYIFEDEGAGA
jgi:hypothetical protein